MRWLLVMLGVLFLTGCDYEEIEREIGYKGKARVNPWLAAERFSAEYGEKVQSHASWKTPEYGDSMWFVPAGLLNNEIFNREVEEWVSGGGHLVLLVEHAESETSDWSRHFELPQIATPLVSMLDRSGITLKAEGFTQDEMKAKEVKLDGKVYEVDAVSHARVSSGKEEPGVFTSVPSGEGRISVLTDARLFRNRWIGDHEHAALLDALIRISEYEGNIGFLRGSGLSLWGLLGEHLWPVLIGLLVLTLLWLWKNFTRFGPMESATEVSHLRGYEHHLEALGDFQWRLDRAAALLVPLRAQIVETGQRIATRSGRRDDDFMQFLADRAGIPRERVHRALVETSPPDPAILTRTAADLQRLIQVLH
ncbi:MAG: hypothetical protein EOP88_22820 [Verrucomicrobiaceae bacterium]|nr:MAG: hypothetical protein EOP88_22820 [Verrucomicrobiaceae bacterium]